MSKPVIAIGAGGHAKVIIDALRKSGRTVVAAMDANKALHGKSILGVRVVGDDDALSDYNPADVDLALGIGIAGKNPINALSRRSALARQLAARGYNLAAVVHPGAIIAEDTRIAQGAQIMAGAVVQAGSRIGEMAIVNTCASIDHDCDIGLGVHVSPRAVMGGTVRLGDGSFVGIGAVILPGLVIEKECLIAAGAVVIRSLARGSRVAGVPAETIQ